MNKDFLQLLMDRTGFPDEAKAAYNRDADKLDPAAMDGAIEFFYENDFDIGLVTPLINEMAERDRKSVV